MRNLRGILLGVLAGLVLSSPALADPSPPQNAPGAATAAPANPDDAVLDAVRSKLSSQPAASDERDEKTKSH